MILIAGLGNPGAKYEKTRHNVGFRVIDELAARWKLAHFDGKFQADLAKGAVRGKSVILLKPQTFMNLSGASVGAAARFYKISIKDKLWVIHDDLDLPLGHLRIRLHGTSGGHRGVQSIIESLGTMEFPRFRVGIGRPADRVPVDDYVLQPFKAAEKSAVAEIVKRAADAVETALNDGLVKAMNLFNK